MNSPTKQDSRSDGENILKRAALLLSVCFFRSSRSQRICAYVLSILTVALATALRIGLDPVLGEHHPFTLYFAAVAVASWYGGLGPGVLAIVLSYFAADWFFIAPRFEFNWPHSNLDEFLALMAFLFSSFAIAFTSKIMRQALLRARRKQHELELEIAERRRAEELLKKAQDQLRGHAAVLEEHVRERTAHLQETVRSLEGVCYHIAHDLRAPLRAMEGFTNILSEQQSSGLDVASRSHLERIGEAARRMELLLNGLLEYGRLGHEQFALGPVSPLAVLEDATHELEPQIARTNARLAIPDSLPQVVGNESLLFIVFFNLLSNALKFVRPDTVPMIKISADTVVSDPDGPEFVRFFIEDNGIGIPAQNRHKAFWIFERLHPGTEYPGVGIGLALVSKAVERMRGRVGIEPGLAQGSRFWLELPLSTAERLKTKSTRPEKEILAVH